MYFPISSQDTRDQLFLQISSIYAKFTVSTDILI